MAENGTGTYATTDGDAVTSTFPAVGDYAPTMSIDTDGLDLGKPAPRVASGTARPTPPPVDFSVGAEPYHPSDGGEKHVSVRSIIGFIVMFLVVVFVLGLGISIMNGYREQREEAQALIAQQEQARKEAKTEADVLDKVTGQKWSNAQTLLQAYGWKGKIATITDDGKAVIDPSNWTVTKTEKAEGVVLFYLRHDDNGLFGNGGGSSSDDGGNDSSGNDKNGTEQKSDGSGFPNISEEQKQQAIDKAKEFGDTAKNWMGQAWDKLQSANQ